MSAVRQQTLFPRPPASLFAGKSREQLDQVELPVPRPMPVTLTTNPALNQARVVENVFTPDECERIMAIGQRRPREDARVQSSGNAARIGHVSWIDPGQESIWVYQRLGAVVAWVNQAFQFDLMGFADALQFTVYGAGHKFDWHLDIGAAAASLRKLSISVQLSGENAYQGGGLQFISAPDVTMPKTRGAAILFPAYLAHRVQDVTEGVRCSLVGWAAGNPYR